MMEKWFVWMVVLLETISIWQDPGFYFLARHMGIPHDPTYQILQQLCSQAGYKLPFSHDIDILLPEDKFIENFQSLRDRDIVRCISSHENCGAAKRI
jgi:3'-phosphoadenosine 5'-phosphosulfate sulfotransferase (PAPS reductase)/FAD synthetase